MTPYKPYWLGLIGAFMLCSFALVNGYAVLFSDSRSYVRGGSIVLQKVLGVDEGVERWQPRQAKALVAGKVVALPAAGDRKDKVVANPVTGNRSIYYGILAAVGYLYSDFWLVIAVQAYVVATLIALVFVRGVNQAGIAPYAVAMALLSAFTSVGPTIAYVMPDIFAPVIILVTALVLVYWKKLQPGDRVFLFGACVFAAAVHPSHLLITAMAIGLGVVAQFFMARTQRKWRELAFLVGVFASASALLLAFNLATTRLTGEKPMMLPHITAHLVEMGPGMDYIDAYCPQAGFAVCKYKERLPVGWVDFMFSIDPDKGIFELADRETRRALSDEQVAFAFAVFRHEPLQVIGGASRDVVLQLQRFSLDNMKVIPKARANFSSAFPPDVWAGIRASRIAQGDGFLDLMSRFNLIAVLGSLAVLGAALAGGRQRLQANSGLAWFCVLLFTGVVVNAVVCGALASPDPRFQTRVIWLIPLAALVLIAEVVRGRRLAASGAASTRR